MDKVVLAESQKCRSADKGRYLLTIEAKCVLRDSGEKCLKADEVFGLVVPIDRSSRHRSLLDFVRSLSIKIFTFGCVYGVGY